MLFWLETYLVVKRSPHLIKDLLFALLDGLQRDYLLTQFHNKEDCLKSCLIHVAFVS